MPSRQCLVCRRTIPAAHYAEHRERHRRQVRDRPGSTRAWRRLREMILRRDGYRCVICRSEDRLEVHHIDGDWRNDAPENLETRCFAHNPRGQDFVNLPTSDTSSDMGNFPPKTIKRKPKRPAQP